MQVSAKKQQGFTLVEMLVVIGIIGILASMLLSVLGRGKQKALQSQCLSQTKQLALALQMYTQDNRDCMPWPNWGNRFPGWLYTPVGGQPPEPSEAVYEGGMLWQYIKVTKIYWCPLDRTNTPYFPKRPEKLSSYIFNGGIMGYYRIAPASRTHRLSEMNPMAYATWEPSDNPPFDPGKVFNDGASYPMIDEGPSNRHGSGCNVSSFDGHAQLLNSVNFEHEQDVQPGLLWCDPDTPDGSGGDSGRNCGLWK